LFELIDGGADIYMEYGFSQVITAEYIDPSQNKIQVEIYEMTDDPSAYGIFSISQQTAEWSEEYGNLSVVKDDYIFFWKSKYYINLSWSSRQYIDEPLLAKLAGLVDLKIQEAGEFPLLVKSFLVDKSGIKTIYLKGNIALSNFYYFDYKDIFRINQGIAWTPGGYQRIIIKYIDPAEAIEIMTSARQSISNNKRFTDVTMAFQGLSCRDNKGNQILIRQINEYIAVLVGLEENITLVPLMDKVSMEIESIAR